MDRIHRMDVVNTAALPDLTNLVNLGVLVKEATGRRSTSYVLVDRHP